jgi:hypothetical protein
MRCLGCDSNCLSPILTNSLVSRCKGSRLFVISDLKHVVENSCCLLQFSHKYNLVIKACMLVAYCAIIAMSYRISVDLDDREREKCPTFS